MELTADQIERSHIIAAAEDIRTAALRNAKSIDSLMSDIRHAIENGRQGAALSLLTSIDAFNRSTISTTSTPINPA